MFSVLLPQNAVSMLEWTNNPSWTHCISLFPRLDLQDIFVLSDAGHQICPSGMEAFVCTHLYAGYFHWTHGFYTRYMVFGGCFSLKETSPPKWSDWCRYAARTSSVSYMWRPWMVAGDSSLKLSRMRQHSRYPAFTFSGVPVAKSNIIGVFPKCQDTEAVSQFRGWILQGPHFSCRYVIRSQWANKNCLILQFTGHLMVLAKNLEKSVRTDYQLWFSGG